MRPRRGWVIPSGLARSRSVRDAVREGGVAAAAVLGMLYTICDAYGVAPVSPGDLCLELAALGLDDAEMESALAGLAHAGLVQLYEAQGERYARILGWDGQQPEQALQRRGRGMYPRPPQAPPDARASETSTPSVVQTTPDNSRVVPTTLDNSGEVQTALDKSQTYHRRDRDMDQDVSRESSSSSGDDEYLDARARAREDDDDDDDDDDLSPTAIPDAVPESYRERVDELAQRLEAAVGGRDTAYLWAGELLAGIGDWRIAAAAVDRATRGGRRVGSLEYLRLAAESVRSQLAAGGRAAQPPRPAPTLADVPEDRPSEETERHRAARDIVARLPDEVRERIARAYGRPRLAPLAAFVVAVVSRELVRQGGGDWQLASGSRAAQIVAGEEEPVSIGAAAEARPP